MTTTEQLAAQTAAIKAAVDANPEGFMAGTTDLREADFALIGKVIQLYCFADLNARRIIDALRHAALGADERIASRLKDAQVFPKLREAADHLPPSNMRDGILRAAETVEMHRVHRHNFAHWAARRVREADALVIFTKNAREAERRDGEAQTPEELKYAIVPLASFPGELVKLAGHTDYLATTAAYIEQHFEQIRSELSETKGD